MNAREFAAHFGVALSDHCELLRKQGLSPPVDLLELRDVFIAAAKSVHVRPTGDGRWRVVDDAAMATEPRVEPLILTYEQAGQVLGLSARTIRRLVSNGDLRTVTVNGGRKIHRDDLVEYAASLRTNAVQFKGSDPVPRKGSDPVPRATTPARWSETPSHAPVDFSPLSMPLRRYVETLERGRDEWR